MCCEVLFCVGWNLGREILLEFKSKKAPGEVAWPRVLQVTAQTCWV